jgi:archaeosine-15-forming tRNA-guanine transglycosylase
MRDTDYSIEDVDFQFTDEIATVFFPEKSEVFEMHQSGAARGGRVRKVVPEEEDFNSPPMEQSYERVGQILEEHFNGA